MTARKEKMKFLAIKLSALQSELLISREILKSASADVDKMFKEKYFPEASIVEKTEDSKDVEQFREDKQDKSSAEKEDPEHENQLEDSSLGKIADPEVKKMFKKIATQCHPDKLEELEDGFEKRKKEKLYQKARQALENNDMLIMVDIASELEIETPDITPQQLKQTEEKIIAIKRELSMIESTAVWQWFFTEDTAKKDFILKQLFQVMYEQQQKQYHSRA